MTDKRNCPFAVYNITVSRFLRLLKSPQIGIVRIVIRPYFCIKVTLFIYESTERRYKGKNT